MCTKRLPDEVCQPVADLDTELGPVLHDLVHDGSYAYGVNVGGAWVGGYAFYSQMANV